LRYRRGADEADAVGSNTMKSTWRDFRAKLVNANVKIETFAALAIAWLLHEAAAAEECRPGGFASMRVVRDLTRSEMRLP